MHPVLSIISSWPFYHNYEMTCPLFFSFVHSILRTRWLIMSKKPRIYPLCQNLKMSQSNVCGGNYPPIFFYFTLHKNTPRPASVVHLAYLVDVCQDTVLAWHRRNVGAGWCAPMWLCNIAFISQCNSKSLVYYNHCVVYYNNCVCQTFTPAWKGGSNSKIDDTHFYHKTTRI